MTRLLLALWLAACPSVEAPVANDPSEEVSLETVSEHARQELESRGLDQLKWAITPFRGGEEGPSPYAPLFC